MKKSIIIVLLLIMMFTLTPVKSDYANAITPAKTKQEIRMYETGNKDKSQSKKSIIVEGTEFYLIMIPAPKVDVQMLIPAPEVNDPIFVLREEVAKSSPIQQEYKK